MWPKICSFTLKAVCLCQNKRPTYCIVQRFFEKYTHARWVRTQNGAFPNMKTYVFILRDVKVAVNLENYRKRTKWGQFCIQKIV